MATGETPIPFYDSHAYVSGLEFEYCIKTNPHLLNPLWKGRPKDLWAIAWLDGELSKKHIDRTKILLEIWAENPFWAKKGYPEYETPVLAEMRFDNILPQS